MKSKLLFGVLRSAVVVACIVVAFSVSQSCSDKPNDDSDPVDTMPSWRQYELDVNAAWSPDGSKIIYFRFPPSLGRDTAWQWGVFIHDISTAKDTCLWPNFRFLYCCWSPDGNKIAYTDAEAQVFVHDFIEGSSRRLTYGHRFHSPRWSPCGDKLAFVERTNDGGLFLWDFEADSLIHINSRAEADAADWMADCSTLVMHDSTIYPSVHDSSVIVKYNIYTDSLSVIAKLAGYKYEIRISPDQQTIIFGIRNNLWGISINGGEPYQLTTEGGGFPDFSPDGQWIVYTRINPWYAYLWLMRPDGSEKHQITF